MFSFLRNLFTRESLSQINADIARDKTWYIGRSGVVNGTEWSADERAINRGGRRTEWTSLESSYRTRKNAGVFKGSFAVFVEDFLFDGQVGNDPANR